MAERAHAATLDLPAFTSAFGQKLRGQGVPGAPERYARLARALQLAPPRTRSELYWTARVVLVSAREQLAAFDRVFAATFDGAFDLAELRGDRSAPPLRSAEVGSRRAAVGAEPLGAPPTGARAAVGGLSDAADPREREARELPVAAASRAERLAARDFAELGPEELRALATLAQRLLPPLRPSRRLHQDRHGAQLDLRATLRASRRAGGETLRLIRRRRATRPRRLVLLCDISGSMEPYARAFMQFLYAAVGAQPAEAFVFATRLTRLTRALRGGQPDLAIQRATATARDWSGGTRIGQALARFNNEYGRRGMARGAVVVILSDGWERDDPALVGREMERLRRLAHRIVWVNPRKAAPNFAPLAAGMAAALPWCDLLLAGNTLHALTEVADALSAGRVDRAGRAGQAGQQLTRLRRTGSWRASGPSRRTERTHA